MIMLNKSNRVDTREGAKQRKAAQRKRDRAAGLIRLELKVKPEHKQSIIDFAAKLMDAAKPPAS